MSFGMSRRPPQWGLPSSYKGGGSPAPQSSVSSIKITFYLHSEERRRCSKVYFGLGYRPGISTLYYIQCLPGIYTNFKARFHNSIINCAKSVTKMLRAFLLTESFNSVHLLQCCSTNFHSFHISEHSPSNFFNIFDERVFLIRC